MFGETSLDFSLWRDCGNLAFNENHYIINGEGFEAYL